MALRTMVTNGDAYPVPATQHLEPAPNLTAEALLVPRTYIENGRRYHRLNAGSYLLPCDDPEQARMDIIHQLFKVARDGKLFERPLRLAPGEFDQSGRGELKIIDVGCGTGIWAISVGDMFAGYAQICCLDLVPIQPSFIAPGMEIMFDVDFELDPWLKRTATPGRLREGVFDLVHFRMLLGSVSHWPEMYAKAYRHLGPGGFLEHVEIDFEPRPDRAEDLEMVRNSSFMRWYELICRAFEKHGRPFRYNHNTTSLLASMGFTEIADKRSIVPVNGWSREKKDHDVGRWFNLVLVDGMEAMSYAPLIRIEHWTREDVQILLEEVKKELTDRKFRVYCEMHVVTARKQ